MNFEILDVNEAPEFQGYGAGTLFIYEGEGVLTLLDDFYSFNPWGLENLNPDNHPDTDHDEAYGIYVGNVEAIDPDYLDQPYSMVNYRILDAWAVGPLANDPFNPGVEDTAGSRPDDYDVYSINGALFINPETGDIWLSADMMQGWIDDPSTAPIWNNPQRGLVDFLVAHDNVDRLAPVTDAEGNVVYDNDRIYSDLWDMAYLYIEADQAPVLSAIDPIYESMQTRTGTLVQESGIWGINSEDGIESQGYFVLNATDPDGTPVSFATGSDAYGDTASFNVQKVGDEWRLYFDNSVLPLADIDYENPSDTGVTATGVAGDNFFGVELILDDGFMDFTQQVTVNLDNANETPWFTGVAAVDSIRSGATAHAKVAEFTVNDYDNPETLSVELLSDDPSFDPENYFTLADQGSGVWQVQVDPETGYELADLIFWARWNSRLR